MVLATDLTGQTFGELKVQERGASTDEGHARWNCVCSCGVQKLIRASLLKNGKATTCGTCKGAYVNRGTKADTVRFRATTYASATPVKLPDFTSRVSFTVLFDVDGKELWQLKATSRQESRSRDVLPGSMQTLTAMVKHKLATPKNNRSDLQWVKDSGLVVNVVTLGSDTDVYELYARMYPNDKPIKMPLYVMNNI